MKRKLLISLLLFVVLIQTVTAQESGRIDVQFGSVKITETGSMVFGLYQKGKDIVFIQSRETVNSEEVQFQIFFTKDSNTSIPNVIVEEYIRNDNGSKEDVITKTFEIIKDQENSAYVDIALTSTEIERVVVVKYEDIRFVFYHLTDYENLVITETLTLKEINQRFIEFGWISFVVTALSFGTGVLVDQKAKDIPVPSQWIMPISGLLFFALGVLNATSLISGLFIDRAFFFIAVSIIGFVLGIIINTESLIEYIGFKRSIRGLKETRELVTARLYQFQKDGRRLYGIAMNGFWEAIKRLFGNHIEFHIIENHSIDVKGYVKGFEIESEGFRGKERVYEWITVSNHKLPTRLIQSYNKRISYYENKFNEIEQENTDLKSNKAIEVNRKVALALESHYSKMGVNMWETQAVSNDTMKLVAERNGLSEEELQKLIEDEKKDLKENGKLTSRIRRKLRRFDG